jgi:hypothetical protein
VIKTAFPLIDEQLVLQRLELHLFGWRAQGEVWEEHKRLLDLQNANDAISPVDQIPPARTLISLLDGPFVYDDTKVLTSGAFGWTWETVSGMAKHDHAADTDADGGYLVIGAGSGNTQGDDGSNQGVLKMAYDTDGFWALVGTT